MHSLVAIQCLYFERAQDGKQIEARFFPDESVIVPLKHDFHYLLLFRFLPNMYD